MRRGFSSQPEGALVLRDCRVVVELGGPAIEGEVWIASDRVVQAGSVPTFREQTLDGRVVAPGLIDAHVHLCFDASEDPLGSFRLTGPQRMGQVMQAHATLALRAGVTLVRDLGAPTEMILVWRETIASSQILAPRVLASGAPITIPGGHLHEMGGAVAGPSAIRAAVRAHAQAGVDVIKAVATGGGSSPQTDPGACQFTDDELLALADEARRARLPVACHAHADAGVRQAITARVNTIEHGSYASDASLRAMAEQGTALVPTLVPAINALARSSLPRQRKGQIRERLESRREAVRLAVRHGVRIVAGTDAGVAFTPHGSVVSEILALADCGVPPALALAAAGREAAAALGVPDAGTLMPGARADLVVLEGNPIADLRYLQQPFAVMRAGRWVTIR